MSGTGGARLGFVLGPCVLESESLALECAEAVARFAERRSVQVVFKSSYDKANRSHVEGYRGPGLDTGLRWLERVRAATGLAVLTDVHSVAEARAAAEVVDVLQVPAFLCRQTDLLLAAAASHKPVLVKKGQFMPPGDMAHVREKLVRGGAGEVWLCERGSSFGHGDLVVDMRALVWMREIAETGAASDGVATRVVFDATHSVQQRTTSSSATGGRRDLVPALARAAVAVGVDLVFAEVHPEPARARSDAASQWPLDALDALLEPLLRIHGA